MRTGDGAGTVAPMPALSALLRALLCLALILNGSGAAVAATQMQMGHLAAVTPAPVMEHHGAMSPCHGEQAVAHHTPPAPHPSPDCCQSAQCACDCLQHLTATATGFFVPMPMLAHAPVLRPMHAGHPSPALANPIRPPIA